MSTNAECSDVMNNMEELIKRFAEDEEEGEDEDDEDEDTDDDEDAEE